MVQAERGDEAADLGAMPGGDAVTIDFTVEGLVVLCELADLPGLPGLGSDPLGGLSAETRDLVLDSARRSLVARRMIRAEGETFVLDAAVHAFLEVVSTPGIVVRAVHEAGDRIETRFISAVPDIAVEHSVVLGSIQRFTPFPTDALLARALQFLQLVERPEIQAEPFDISIADLTRVAEHLNAGDRVSAKEMLVGGGALDSAAGKFLDALQARRSSSSVTILHRPDENHLEGGELTWIDAGNDGLWLTPLPGVSDSSEVEEREGTRSAPLPGGDGDSIRVEPTSAASIASELLSYLPGAGPIP